ncbi:MAG: class SAM-dependent methyltransferase [Nocardioides sp.]|nr:class SAM-dependent methyltransferase [Nocardioides sp.]
MRDPDAVRRQYATETNLETRRAVWHPAADGREPVEIAAAVVRASGPRAILEVGCGTGAFAERLTTDNPAATVIATDQSERFVELTAARGVSARLADVQDLPFADASFDLVAAMWMLYHVSDVDRGLAEIRRVLRPGGRFLAVTNGDEHVADLRRDAGGSPLVTAFSSENAQPALLRHFDDVRREDLRPRAVFPDHAAAVAYLASSNEGLGPDLPEFDGPREYAGHVTVFVCR